MKCRVQSLNLPLANQYSLQPKLTANVFTLLLRTHRCFSFERDRFSFSCLPRLPRPTDITIIWGAATLETPVAILSPLPGAGLPCFQPPTRPGKPSQAQSSNEDSPAWGWLRSQWSSLRPRCRHPPRPPQESAVWVWVGRWSRGMAESALISFQTWVLPFRVAEL